MYISNETNVSQKQIVSQQFKQSLDILNMDTLQLEEFLQQKQLNNPLLGVDVSDVRNLLVY